MRLSNSSLGKTALIISCINIGWLIFLASYLRVILNSLLAFFIGIGIAITSIILLWKLKSHDGFLRDHARRDMIIHAMLIVTPIIIGLVYFIIAFNGFDITNYLSWINSYRIIYLTNFVFYFLGTLFVTISGLLIYKGMKRIKNHEITKKKRFVVTLGIIFMFPISLFIPVTLFYPIVPPLPHASLDPGLMTSTDLFVSGVGGYYTYRIPSLLVLPDNTTLAICEARKLGPFDQGDIDLVMKRSVDGGVTWSSMIILYDAGFLTAGNPCPVYNNLTGTIWLPFTVENDVVYMMNSTDGGVTWSPVKDITNDVKPPSWGSNWFAPGPGHGIQLQRGADAGRLIIPTYASPPGSPSEVSFMIYSDDNGTTWGAGNFTTIGSECEVVETHNGSLYLTIRNQFGTSHRRMYAWSHDGGLNWDPVLEESELLTPTCMASIHRFSLNDTETRNRIIFSNPFHTSVRMNMMVHVSYDECETWNVSRTLWAGLAGYSDLEVLPDKTILCFFEMGTYLYHEYLVFVRFNISWLTSGLDTVI